MEALDVGVSDGTQEPDSTHRAHLLRHDVRGSVQLKLSTQGNVIDPATVLAGARHHRDQGVDFANVVARGDNQARPDAGLLASQGLSEVGPQDCSWCQWAHLFHSSLQSSGSRPSPDVVSQRAASAR